MLTPPYPTTEDIPDPLAADADAAAELENMVSPVGFRTGELAREVDEVTPALTAELVDAASQLES